MPDPMNMPSRPKPSSSSTAVVGFLAVLGFAVFVPILAVFGGLVFRYAWDVVVLHTFLAAPRVSLAEAIGLSAIISYYTYSPAKTEGKSTGALLTSAATSIAMFLVTIWIVHFFIPGA